MLKKVIKKRAKIFMLILLLSAFQIVTSTDPASKYLEDDKAGVIFIAKGVYFHTLKGFLDKRDDCDKGIVTSADIKANKRCVGFFFAPSPGTLKKNLELLSSWSPIEEVDFSNLALYRKYSEKIEPENKSWGLAQAVKHFSLYYHRRR